MDKGIRPAARHKFVEFNEQRRRGLMDNTTFRKTVMAYLMEDFNITLASAATHYNDAFKFVKDLNAELVSGLGRPEDKKGGRKPKPKVEAVPAAAPAAETGEELEPGDPVQTVFTVLKKSDGSVIAEGLSLEDARGLVEKAAAAKKAKLYWV